MTDSLDHTGAVASASATVRSRGLRSVTTATICRHIDELIPLKEEWARLARGSRNPLLSFDAILAGARAFYRPGDLHVITLRDADGRLSAIAPLAFVQSSRYPRWLEIIGGSVLHEPTDLLHARIGDLERLLEVILAQGVPILLQRLPSTTPHPRDIMGARIRGLYVERTSAGSQYVDTSCGFEEFEASMSGKRRSDMRRASKRASNAGRVEVRIERPDPHALPELLACAYEIEHASWKGRVGSSILSSPKMSAFLSEYLNGFAEQRQAVIAFLDMDGEPVAMSISIVAYRKLWLLKVGYRESASKLSPGMLMMHELIRYCCESGLEQLEFLGSAERWLNAWPVRTRDYRSCMFYPYSPRGLLALGKDGLSHIRSRLKRPKARC